MEERRWVIVGAGAVGGVIAGRLHQGGASVAVVARGQHGKALQADGLLLRDPDTEVRLALPVFLTVDDVDWRPGDVAVVATKTQDAEAVLDDLVAADSAVPVVCATNGLECERMALRRFDHVHGMCVMLLGNHLEPGVVEASAAPVSGILDVGLAVGGADALDEELAAALRAGHFESLADQRIMARKRTKLLMNLSNVIEAACGKEHVPEDAVAAARAEGIAALAAAGLSRISDEEDQARRADHLQIRPVRGELRGGGSAWQSLARKAGRTEADFLNGEVAMLGRQFGAATPVNIALQHLARSLAASGAAPGSMTPDELRVAVGLAGAR